MKLKTLDLYDLLSSEELEIITETLLEVSAKNGFQFSTFTPIIKIEGELV